jgi:hypothetical protein
VTPADRDRLARLLLADPEQRQKLRAQVDEAVRAQTRGAAARVPGSVKPPARRKPDGPPWGTKGAIPGAKRGTP